MSITIRLLSGFNKTFDKTTLTIGSDPSCDVVIAQSTGVQPLHARLRKIGDRWLLESAGVWPCDLGDPSKAATQWVVAGGTVDVGSGEALTFSIAAFPTTAAPRLKTQNSGGSSAGEGDTAESPQTAASPHNQIELSPQADARVLQQQSEAIDPLPEAPSDNSFNSTKAAIASVIIAFVISLLLTILQRLFYGSWMSAYSLFASTVIMLWGLYFCFRNSASTNAVALKLGIPIGMTTGLLYGLMFASIISSVFYGAFIGVTSVSIFLTMRRQSWIAIMAKWRQSWIAIMANSENKNYTKTLDQTFAAAQNAVRDLGYKVDTLDKANGLIKFKTGMSWKSFAGQEMSVIMIDNGDGSVGVSVSGRRNQSGVFIQAFDWGESAGIAKKVLAKMDGMSDQAQANSRKDSASAGEGDAAESPYTAFSPHIKREVAPQADDRVIQQHQQPETNTTPSEATTDNSFDSMEATIAGVIIAFVISLLLTILQRLFYGSWMSAYSLLASTVIMSWCFYFNYRNSDATNATALKLGIPIGMTTGLLYGLMFASIISSVFYGAFIGVASVSMLFTMGRHTSIALGVAATCCSFIAFHAIGFVGNTESKVQKLADTLGLEKGTTYMEFFSADELYAINHPVMIYPNLDGPYIQGHELLRGGRRTGLECVQLNYHNITKKPDDIHGYLFRDAKQVAHFSYLEGKIHIVYFEHDNEKIKLRLTCLGGGVIYSKEEYRDNGNMICKTSFFFEDGSVVEYKEDYDALGEISYKIHNHKNGNKSSEDYFKDGLFQKGFRYYENGSKASEYFSQSEQASNSRNRYWDLNGSPLTQDAYCRLQYGANWRSDYYSEGESIKKEQTKQLIDAYKQRRSGK